MYTLQILFPGNTSDISQTIKQINLINGNFWSSMEGMLVYKSTQPSHFWLIHFGNATETIQWGK